MHRSLDDYLTLCSKLKVRAEKLVIESDYISKGLIDLIAQHGITMLVMGAAADKHYSRRIKAPTSKTAITVKQQADPSCKIWFVCKRNLICVREPILDDSRITLSPSSSASSSSSIHSEQLRSRSLPQGQSKLLSCSANHMLDLSMPRSQSINFDSHGGGTVPTLPHDSVLRRSVLARSMFSAEGSLTGSREGISRTSQRSDLSLWSTSDENCSNSGTLSMTKDEESEEGSVMLPLLQDSEEDLHFSSAHIELEDEGLDAEVYEEDEGLDAEVYDKLHEALVEVENLKHEAYNESLKRQKAERRVIEALRRTKASESLLDREMNLRKDLEETLTREQLEVEIIKNQRDEISEQLQEAKKHELELELCIADYDSIVKDLEEKLSVAQHLLNTLQVDHEELQLQRDVAVKEVKELQQKVATTSTYGSTTFSEFSFSEVDQATRSFSNMLKIGEGGGNVYKAFLRNTAVAIKMLNPQRMQSQSEFYQKVDVLSRTRHPNLVTLIGACSEAWALIYEFLPNGTLEDRLDCKDNTPPLTWQVRTRIATEICSVLIFLHSNKPSAVVHGDLKPDNILLDAHFVSKLLLQSTVYPKDSCPYRDPELVTTREFTPSSDVYSFGIIILRLLTGRPAVGIAKEVKEALDNAFLQEMIDPTAGDWPFVQAKQLAHLGLRCCEISRKSCQDLVGEAWRVLQPMLKAASIALSPLSFETITDDNSRIPNYFICPIFQEIMRDPHIAADGFTYEAEALKGWIESGHKTSPMTNIPLPHCELIQNHALRSAIQEWLQQHQLS